MQTGRGGGNDFVTLVLNADKCGSKAKEGVIHVNGLFVITITPFYNGILYNGVVSSYVLVTSGRY